jgi:hypothetical protein
MICGYPSAFCAFLSAHDAIAFFALRCLDECVFHSHTRLAKGKQMVKMVIDQKGKNW